MGRTLSLGTAGGLGSLVSALVVGGWAAVVLVVAASVLVGAVCWVVNDRGRAARLALLIRAWRG